MATANALPARCNCSLTAVPSSPLSFPQSSSKNKFTCSCRTPFASTHQIILWTSSRVLNFTSSPSTAISSSPSMIKPLAAAGPPGISDSTSTGSAVDDPCTLRIKTRVRLKRREGELARWGQQHRECRLRSRLNQILEDGKDGWR